MILISARIFGFALKTWKIALGFDLPVEDYKAHVGVLELEVTTGPRSISAPDHTKDMPVATEPNTHDAPSEDLVTNLD